jgi:hypothetical protein
MNRMEAIAEPAGVSDRLRPRPRPNPVVPARMRLTLSCPLCGLAVQVEDEFRAVDIQCAQCNFTFGFDPWEEPLDVPGVRLAPLRREQRPEAEPIRRRAGWPWFSAGVVTLLAAGLLAAGAWAGVLR